LVRLTPAVQRQVSILRENRNLAKQAKELGDTARDFVLDFLGSITANLVGTDAKGKRLISVKVIPSSAKFDWEAFAKDQPELHDTLVKQYTLPKGAGEPTIRVDLI
jgi:hypothetical protein